MNSSRRSSSKSSKGEEQQTQSKKTQAKSGSKYIPESEYRCLEHALRYAYFFGEQKRRVGESVPEPLMKLMHRHKQKPPRGRKIRAWESEAMKSALDSESFRVEAAALYLQALAKGAEPDNWRSVCKYVQSVFDSKLSELASSNDAPGEDQEELLEEAAGEAAGEPSQEAVEEEAVEDLSDPQSEEASEAGEAPEEASEEAAGEAEEALAEAPPDSPEANLADLAPYPHALYLTRPKGWENLYEMHIRLQEDKKLQAKLEKEIQQNQKEINKERKQVVKLKDEKGRLAGDLRELKKQPGLEARKSRDLEKKLRASERKNVEGAEVIEKLQAEVEEERKNTAAARQQVHDEHLKWDEERSKRDERIRELESRLQEQASERRALATKALLGISESLHSSPGNKNLRTSVDEAIEEASKLLEVFLFSSEPRDGNTPPAAPEPRVAAKMPPGVLRNSLTAAEFLCLEKKSFLIIDGYNFIFQRDGHDPNNLPMERDRFWKELEELYNVTGNSSLIIYDGKRSEFFPTKGRGGGVKEVFTVDGADADPLIIQECDKAPRDRVLVVVSEDRGVTTGDLGVRDPAENLGANLLYPHQLLHVIDCLRK